MRQQDKLMRRCCYLWLVMEDQFAVQICELVVLKQSRRHHSSYVENLDRRLRVATRVSSLQGEARRGRRRVSKVRTDANWKAMADAIVE